MGNARIEARHSFAISGFGISRNLRFVGYAPLDLISIPFYIEPGQIVTKEIDQKKPLIGRLTFQAFASYSGNDGQNTAIESQEVGVFFIPYKELGILLSLILCLVIAFAIIKKLRHNTRTKRGWKPYGVEASDNIITLAKKYNIDWLKLARANKIKKPYALSQGQLIMVPQNNEKFNQPSEKQKDPFAREEVEERGSGILRTLLIIIIVLLAVFLVVIVLFFYTQRDSSDGQSIPALETEEFENDVDGFVDPSNNAKLSDIDNDTETIVEDDVIEEDPVPEPEPEPTPSPREQVRVSVLNGSGISGFAGEILANLKGRGFTQINAGNADNFDYQNLIIRHKPGFEPSAKEVEQALSDRYSVITLTENPDQENDIVLILGQGVK
jgi:hypothetical protein